MKLKNSSLFPSHDDVASRGTREDISGFSRAQLFTLLSALFAPGFAHALGNQSNCLAAAPGCDRTCNSVADSNSTSEAKANANLAAIMETGCHLNKVYAYIDSLEAPAPEKAVAAALLPRLPTPPPARPVPPTEAVPASEEAVAAPAEVTIRLCATDPHGYVSVSESCHTAATDKDLTALTLRVATLEGGANPSVRTWHNLRQEIAALEADAAQRNWLEVAFAILLLALSSWIALALRPWRKAAERKTAKAARPTTSGPTEGGPVPARETQAEPVQSEAAPAESIVVAQPAAAPAGAPPSRRARR